jgi:hypothetical protein
MLGVGGLAVALAGIGQLASLRPHVGSRYIPPNTSRDSRPGQSPLDQILKNSRPAVQGPDGNAIPGGPETP